MNLSFLLINSFNLKDPQTNNRESIAKEINIGRGLPIIYWVTFFYFIEQ